MELVEVYGGWLGRSDAKLAAGILMLLVRKQKPVDIERRKDLVGRSDAERVSFAIPVFGPFFLSYRHSPPAVSSCRVIERSLPPGSSFAPLSARHASLADEIG